MAEVRRVPSFDLTKALVYTHRWLGVAGGMLFVTWFVSGIVMVYKRMPRLDPEERLMSLPVLDLSGVRIPPGEAVQLVGLSPDRLRIGMLRDRPVYRFAQGPQWSMVFADTGELLQSLTLLFSGKSVPEHRLTHSGAICSFTTCVDAVKLTARAP